MLKDFYLYNYIHIISPMHGSENTQTHTYIHTQAHKYI